MQARACPGRISAEQEAGKSVATTPQHAGTPQPVPLGAMGEPLRVGDAVDQLKKRRCRRPRQELHRDTAGSGSLNISWTDLVRRMGELDHEPGGRGNGRSGSAVLPVGERWRRQRMVGDGRMGADTERARVGLGHHGREKLPLPNRSAEWASQHGVGEPEHRFSEQLRPHEAGAAHSVELRANELRHRQEDPLPSWGHPSVAGQTHRATCPAATSQRTAGVRPRPEPRPPSAQVTAEYLVICGTGMRPAASLRVRRAGGLQHGRDQCVHERTDPGYHSGHRGSCHEVRVGPVSSPSRSAADCAFNSPSRPLIMAKWRHFDLQPPPSTRGLRGLRG